MKLTDFLRWQMPLILWAGTIIVLTSIPTLKLPDLGFDAEDKVAHIGVYFVLGILFGRAFAKGYFTSNRILLKLLAIVIPFAALDEIHQLFIPGRSGDIFDFIADSIGILAALLSFWLIRKFSGKR